MHGYKFACAKGVCTQVDVDNKPVSSPGIKDFRIIGADKYKLTTFPTGQTITIDNTVIGDQTDINLEAGTHTFTADPNIQTFIIQLDR